MLARRLAIVVALATLVALLVFLTTRDDNAVVREGAAAHADAAAKDARRAELAAAAEGPARSGTSDVLDAAPVGVTFGELLRPITRDEHTPLTEAAIECYAADGRRRRAVLTDDVRSGDLARGGLWLVKAEGHCPRVVDPAFVDALRGAAGFEPIALTLVASGTLVLHIDERSAELGEIEWLALAAEQSRDEVHRWVTGGGSGERGEALAFAVALPDVRALAAGIDEPDAAADAVARVLATGLCSWSSADPAREPIHAWFGLLAHATRVLHAPRDERIVFEDVPAGVALSLSVCGLTHHGVHEASGVAVPSVVVSGATQAGPIELRASEVRGGEERTLFLRRVPFGSVRGRVPPGTEATPLLLLSEREREPAAAQRAAPPGADGVFEWPRLAAGAYRLVAKWRQAGGIEARAVLDFELAPGEQRDLGVLAPALDTRIVIEPRVTVSGVLTTDFDRATTVVRALLRGPIASEDPAAARIAAPSHSIEFALDSPTVFLGFEPGWYRVETVDLAARDGAAAAEFEPTTDLAAAVAAAADARLVLLADPGASAPAELTTEAHIAVDVELARGALLAVTTGSASELPARVAGLTARLVRRGGLDERTLTLGVFGAQDAAPPWNLVAPGEWTLLVGAQLMRSATTNLRFVVARADIVLAPGAVVTHAATLAPAARVRYVTETFDAGVSCEDFPWSARFLESWTQVDAAQIVDGLLPHTRYRIDGRTIETGAAGSEVVLE